MDFAPTNEKVSEDTSTNGSAQSLYEDLLKSLRSELGEEGSGGGEGDVRGEEVGR